MRTRRPGTLSTRLAAVALAALATLTTVSVAWGQALPAIPDPKPLSPAQEAGIRDEMSGLAAVLVNGGKTPDEAKLATNAVGTCLGAAYGYDLTHDQAEAACGEVLDAFIIQPGTTQYQLTADDHAWVSNTVLGWTGELSGLLDPPLLTAAQSTMQACLEGHLKRGEERDDAVRHCLLGILPLLNRPEFRQRLLDAAGKLP
jgi:hypothetical protein